MNNKNKVLFIKRNTANFTYDRSNRPLDAAPLRTAFERFPIERRIKEKKNMITTHNLSLFSCYQCVIHDLMCMSLLRTENKQTLENTTQCI